MDFVKFYIIQLVKNAASRIRVTDKEKELLLSRLVSKIENSQEIFPELKTMERVVELEETASKLISIYRRLNKSHIDLEKISYHFVSDRDAIQSILRRFLQGNFRTGLINKKRPKIVFDDTTFTIYELKESQPEESQEVEQPEIKQSRIDLRDFLKEEKEEIISLKLGESLSEGLSINIEIESVESRYEDNEDQVSKKEKLELDDKFVKKSESEIKKQFEKKVEDLILPLEFEMTEKSEAKKSENDKSDVELEEESETKMTQQGIDAVTKSDDSTLSDENKISEEGLVISENEENSYSVEDDSVNIDKSKQDFESIEELHQSDSGEIENFQETTDKVELNNTKQSELDDKYLEFERLVLENILEVDDFLNRIKSEFVEDVVQLRIIQKAYSCFELARELQFELISEMIKVYWAALVAIRDHRLKPDKEVTDLIRSTLISLTALIKQRDIDLEPFLKKYNQLKTELKSLQYEV